MRSNLDNAILNTMYKGTTTIQDFCWDNLTTVPILCLMSASDINYIQKLITSPRYSGNNKLKMEKIDELMHFRGFTKFAGGTNRIVYTHPSAPNTVFKVAIDAIGINDNPAEFRNQRFLKPYCCKVFECSPCGTIASFEMVDRITTFEEFYTIADDYFYLLSRVILGKYVMEDIGIDYFMNVGIRRGFGVVILDFPYLFELDGSKLECSSELDDGTLCHGEIDYDHGFNKLICSKCGRIYRARDLAKPPKGGGIIVCKKGGKGMKISLMEGDKVLRTVCTESEQEFLSKEKNKNPINKNRKNHFSVSIGVETISVKESQVSKPVINNTVQKTTAHYVEDIRSNTNKTENVTIKPITVSFKKKTCRAALGEVSSEMDSTIKVSVVTTPSKPVVENVSNNTTSENNNDTEEKVLDNVNIIESDTTSTETIPTVQDDIKVEEAHNNIESSHAVKIEYNPEDQIPEMYGTPVLNDTSVSFNMPATDVEELSEVGEEVVEDIKSSNEENIEDDDGELDDIVFVDELPDITDAKLNVAYCKRINPDTDISVYKDVDELQLIPSELFEIYFKDDIAPVFIRYIINADGDIEIYNSEEVDEAMKKLNAENFDIKPTLNITPKEEDAVIVDGDHLDEDKLLEDLKSSSKKISLEDAK